MGDFEERPKLYRNVEFNLIEDKMRIKTQISHEHFKHELLKAIISQFRVNQTDLNNQVRKTKIRILHQ